MDVLLHSDFLETYLNKSSFFNNHDLGKLIWLAINNPSNRLVYSDKYFDLLISSFQSNYGEKYDYMLYDLIVNKNDNNMLCVVNGGSNTNQFEDEFVFLIQHHPENILFILSTIDHSFLSSIAGNKIILSNALPLNSHWVNLHLVANENFEVSSSEFQSNQEISDFFRNIYNIPKVISSIRIFNDYYNFNQNDCFSHLCNGGLAICYYSVGLFNNRGRKTPYSQSDEQRNKNTVKNKFGPTTRYYITYDVTITHRREIAFENLVIVATDDFKKLHKRYKSWRVSVKYSIYDYQTLIADTLKFNEII